jgi:hypothetical protein
MNCKRQLAIEPERHRCYNMMLMVHDDSCGELLDDQGKCPRCNFHPDMQSTAFREVSAEELRTLRAAGRTFVGTHRTPRT